MSARIVNPPDLPSPRGYNQGVILTGKNILFIAGQVGADEAAPAGDFAAQFGKALHRVKRIVEQAGGTVEHIGRLTIYVTDMNEYVSARPHLTAVYQNHFGNHYPAMSVMAVNALLHPYLLVEIEATAVLP